MNIEEASKQRHLMASRLGSSWSVEIDNSQFGIQVTATHGSCSVTFNELGNNYSAFVRFGPNFSAHADDPVRAVTDAIQKTRGYFSRISALHDEIVSIGEGLSGDAEQVAP